jgi:hypothetical protein
MSDKLGEKRMLFGATRVIVKYLQVRKDTTCSNMRCRKKIRARSNAYVIVGSGVRCHSCSWRCLKQHQEAVER